MDETIAIVSNPYLQVMVHQFGHVVGLSHTNRVTSAMVPYYYDWIAEAELRPDHIDIDMLVSGSKLCYDRSIVVFSLIITTLLLQ